MGNVETWQHLLLFVDFFHEIHDLFVAGTNLLDRYIMVDDIDDTCKIFAHICFDHSMDGQEAQEYDSSGWLVMTLLIASLFHNMHQI